MLGQPPSTVPPNPDKAQLDSLYQGQKHSGQLQDGSALLPAAPQGQVTDHPAQCVDLAKAFDSVSWPFLLDVLRHAGFGRRWTNWIANILSSSSTRVLLNGRAGQRICHARGLRQGDPLSPMLFVLSMEVLNALIRRADSDHLLSPIGHDAISFRASFYADDMVVFVRPVQHDMRILLAILEVFERASGLKANREKSKAISIGCTVDVFRSALALLGCLEESLPCIYLGIPLSIRKLRRSDEQPLIDAVAKRIPTWKGNMMNLAGRCTLVSATLSAIPVYTSMAICLSSWAIQCIDRCRRGFLWAGCQSVAGGKCKVA